MFNLICEGNTYNLIVQRNCFQKQSPIASPQNCVLQISSKFTGGDLFRNVIWKKCSIALMQGCSTKNFASDLQNTFLEEHFSGTGSVFYIVCFGTSNRQHILLTSFDNLLSRICRLIKDLFEGCLYFMIYSSNNFPNACCKWSTYYIFILIFSQTNVRCNCTSSPP